MNSKDARVPVVYKLNASYTHFFSDRLRVGISAYANWARHNYMYVDRNMVDEPYFRIAAEGESWRVRPRREYQYRERSYRLDART